SPTVLFDALRLLRSTRTELADRLEVIFAGPISEPELAQIHDPALGGLVRSVGMLDRSRTLALQQAADSLLVMATSAGERGRVAGKLFEYLTEGPPILVVGDHSETARIVAETCTGESVSSDSPRSVAEGLVRLVEGVRPERCEPAIAMYSWEILGEQASQLIE